MATLDPPSPCPIPQEGEGLGAENMGYNRNSYDIQQHDLSGPRGGSHGRSYRV